VADHAAGGGHPPAARTGFWREPLLHFLVAGALLFALYRLVGGEGAVDPAEIVVTAAQVDVLAAGFTRTWSRPPTPPELDELVAEYVVEEIYYREALALGLDRDDTVIRRRLRQKMEFLGDTGAADPTDADLEAHLARHPDRFTGESRTSFVQVFVTDEPGAEAAAARILGQLRAAGAAARPLDFGAATLLPTGMEVATPRDIESVFGRELATALAGVPPGEWAGPLRSSYGWHVVRVTARSPAAVPELGAIRTLVAADWQEDQRRAAVAATLADLRRKYAVRVEPGPARQREGNGP
jgi:hypothetical protein